MSSEASEKQPSLLETTNRDPFARYEELRAKCPVSWDSELTGWLLTEYEHCAYVGRNEELFALPYHRIEGSDRVWGKRGIFMLTGADQRALHKRLSAYLNAKARDRAFRADFIDPLVGRLIDRFADDSQAELAKQFADALPLRVVGVLLGLDWRNDALLDGLKVWIDDVGRWAELLHTKAPEESDMEREWDDTIAGWRGSWREVIALGLASNDRLRAELLPLIRLRREAPGDDLLSEIWDAGRAQFPDWDEQDVLGQAILLCVAGSRTTSTMLCNALHLLLTRPDVRERVVAAPDRVMPAFVEETLRLLPSLHVRLRIAARDTEIGGTQIRAGDVVRPITAAANRDPAHYPHPAEVDLERTAFMDHQAFNVGPRACVGASLARTQGIAALTALLARLSGLRLDPERPAPTFVGFNNRAYRPLHVRFEARR